MIDVHSHVIHGVDDGSRDIETSIKMIEDEISQGVEGIICTPHFRRGSFEAENEEIEEKFKELESAVKERGLNVGLWLGREITYDRYTKNLLKEGKLSPLAGGKYLLLEFPFDENTDIDEACYEMGLLGYKVVVAHAERYPYFRDYEKVEEVRRNGAMIQVNAAAAAGRSGIRENLFVKGLFKRGLVDVVGSDYHHRRKNEMRAAYEKISRKYPESADKIFSGNAKNIIG